MADFLRPLNFPTNCRGNVVDGKHVTSRSKLKRQISFIILQALIHSLRFDVFHPSFKGRPLPPSSPDVKTHASEVFGYSHYVPNMEERKGVWGHIMTASSHHELSIAVVVEVVLGCPITITVSCQR